jgi:hypothetical protein
MIELGWSVFKVQVLDNPKWQWVYFDVNDTYHIYAKQSSLTVLCKIHQDSGADQIEFEAGYKDNATAEIAPIVTTQEEKNDKVLKLASGIEDFASGVAVISIQVPGTPGGTDGRWAAGGYCFADVWTIGDRVTKVQVVDTDNLLGYGSGTVLKEYYDSELPEPNQGWQMYPAHSGSGEIEIDPIGGYGFIPAGLYLEIHSACANATKLAACIWWGKEE